MAFARMGLCYQRKAYGVRLLGPFFQHLALAVHQQCQTLSTLTNEQLVKSLKLGPFIGMDG